MAGHRSKNEPPVEVKIAVAIGGAIGKFFRFLTGKGEKTAQYQLRASEAAHIRDHWASVERYAASAVTYGAAITEADKLLDSVFISVGVPGQTMGERLQSLRTHFAPSLYQEVWEAHKLRNRIAHEVGVVVSEQMLRSALHTFIQALRSFGAFV